MNPGDLSLEFQQTLQQTIGAHVVIGVETWQRILTYRPFGQLVLEKLLYY